MNKLQGKVAVVTGASKGIGAGIAKAFAVEGASVVVNYASSAADADRVVTEIVGHGGQAVAVHGDVSKSADVKRLFDETVRAYGKVDVVVNNAGVYAFGSLDEVTEESFHRQYDVNVLGTLLVTQEAARRFGDKGGSVVNVSSVVSESPPATAAVYASTKAAVDAITLSTARELGPRNIRVNVIAPGITASEGLQNVGIRGSEFETQMVAQTPLGRIGQPADIARVAVFLASDDAAWLTGERIGASGGLR